MLAKHSTLLDNYNVRKSFPRTDWKGWVEGFFKSFPWDLKNQIRQRKLPFKEEYIIIMDSFGRQTYPIDRRKDLVPKLCLKLKITGVNCNFWEHGHIEYNEYNVFLELGSVPAEDFTVKVIWMALWYTYIIQLFQVQIL